MEFSRFQSLYHCTFQSTFTHKVFLSSHILDIDVLMTHGFLSIVRTEWHNLISKCLINITPWRCNKYLKINVSQTASDNNLYYSVFAISMNSNPTFSLVRRKTLESSLILPFFSNYTFNLPAILWILTSKYIQNLTTSHCLHP